MRIPCILGIPAYLIWLFAAGLFGAETGSPLKEPPELQVIGGVDSLISEYPWMGALANSDYKENTKPFCGCTVIDSHWILTAAHCVDRRVDYADFVIVFGYDNPEQYDINKIYRPGLIIIHPEYAGILGAENDLALIQLSRPLPEEIQKVPLISSASIEEDGLMARILGWGDTTPNPAEPIFPAKLQQADVPIVSMEFANQENYFNGVVTDKMITAGASDPLRSASFGDSGGPLLGFNETTDRWEQIGIASFAALCSKMDNPYTVFTRISEYTDWIENIVSNDFLQWVSDRGVGPKSDIDHDGIHPLTEWQFGMDPLVRDSKLKIGKISLSKQKGGNVLYWSLENQNISPIWDISTLFSSNLKTWLSRPIELDLVSTEVDPVSGASRLNIPLWKQGQPGKFFKLVIHDRPDYYRGPIPLRVGSRALGQNGVYRTDYLLEVIDKTKPIRINTHAVYPPNQSEKTNHLIQLYDTVSARLLREETATDGDEIDFVFIPNENEDYLLRVILGGTGGPFEVRVDYGNEDPPTDYTLPISGSLTPEDTPYRRRGHYSDRYKFGLEIESNINGKGNIYRIRVTSDELDSFVAYKTDWDRELQLEVDEEPFGVQEEFLLDVTNGGKIEIIVGSFLECGSGAYELFIHRVSELARIQPGNSGLGLIRNKDVKAEIDGVRLRLDSIRLINLNYSAGVTVKVEGIGGFIPAYSILDFTNQSVVHEAIGFCEGSEYYFIPQEGIDYRLAIAATEQEIRSNYRFSVSDGNTLGTNLSSFEPIIRDPSLEGKKLQAVKSRRLFTMFNP